MADEIPLHGGVVNEVVRVGDTVRRSAGPWTPTVQALLRHLASVGFRYSPRVLGMDERGREVLSYLDGVPGLRPWLPVLRADRGLVGIGRMLRGLSAAIESFEPPADASWRSSPGVALAGGNVRHGDLGPWNLLWSGDELVGLLDWDFAEPAPPLWDLAQAAWYAVPLFRADRWRDCGFDAEPDRRHRLAVLCEAYGAEPAAVLDALDDLVALEHHRTATLGADGVAPFDAFLARGDLTELEQEATWLREHRADLV